MDQVKWIKITTGMFEDEKIDFIESLPEADAILVIWVKLLTLAGKCNSKGYIMLTENIPYTVGMLAHKFKRKDKIVELALETFARLDMIKMNEDEPIYITNWERHQSLDKLAQIRDKNRERQQRFRERKQQELLEDSNVNDSSDDCDNNSIKDVNSNVTHNAENNVTVTQCNALDIDIDIDKDKDKDIKDICVYNGKCAHPDLDCNLGKKCEVQDCPIVEVWSHYTSIFKPWYQPRSFDRKRKSKIAARLKKFSRNEICHAIDNLSKSSWHTGDHPDSSKFFATPEFIFRNDEKIEEWKQAKSKIPKNLNQHTKWEQNLDFSKFREN